MKRLLFFGCALFTSVVLGQNVTENRVTFNYIQLPTNPIDKQYTTFNVVVERKYEKANEDSLAAYQVRLSQATQEYEALMSDWRERKKIVLRDYYTKMAVWQKQVDAGNTSAQKPTDPIIPPQPAQVEVELPKLHSDVIDDQVANSISLAGYNRGQGGATVTIGIQALSNLTIQMSQEKKDNSVKYTYTANYILPLEVKVEDPSQGVVLQTIILNSVMSYTIGTYDSQYEYDLWKIDNNEGFWSNLEKQARNTALSEANTFINDKCGFPVKSRSIFVYTVKKHKEHQYYDLTNAYTAAMQGYQMISQSKDRKTAESKINEAIAIWKQMLTESNVADNDARINDKVTALLYANLAEAYIWLSDFDSAEMYMNLATNSGVGKFKRAVDDLQGYITENKLRWNTNY